MANLKTISQFKSRLAGGGARPNLFEVHIPSFPTAANEAGADWTSEAQEDFRFLCKAAALPASNNGVIDVPFRGRILKVAGDRTFDTWTVTVINDEDFVIRTQFEYWMNAINKLTNNSGATNPDSYMVDAHVSQLGRGQFKEATTNNPNTSDQTPLRTYTFKDIFPTNISQIDLSYDTGDTIEEFTVEFQVNYFTVGGSLEAASGSETTAGDQANEVVS